MISVKSQVKSLKIAVVLYKRNIDDIKKIIIIAKVNIIVFFDLII